VADIFALPEKREALLQLPRMGEKSCDNLLASIEGAKRGRTFSQLLTALGIPLVGTVAARQVAAHYSNLRALLDTPSDAVREALGSIHGIGPKLVESIVGYFMDPVQRQVLEKLLALGVVADEPVRKPLSAAEGPLQGMSFCVTGVLSEPREAVHAKIRAAGGDVHDRVKKDTTYLVAGDKVGEAKLKAATKQGAKIIDEAALAQLIAGAA
jgi:DNA ligase (NAD+)